MKDKPNDTARLLHMADAIAEIEVYVAGMDYIAFEKDSKTRFASIKQLEIIGEAAYHLSAQLKERHSEVQWEPIIALAHIGTRVLRYSERHFVEDYHGTFAYVQRAFTQNQ